MPRAIVSVWSRRCGVLLALPAAAGAAAQALDFTDKEQWTASVGPFATADFIGFPKTTFITDQYSDLGILFTEGNDSTYPTPSFVNDGFGLDGNGDINVVFDTPRWWIGVDFPGYLDIELYSKGELIHTGVFGFGGVGNFGGVISFEPFDAARLIEPGGEADIDDLHFGPPSCRADVDGDVVVGLADFQALLVAWGTDPGGPPDVDADGDVDIVDFLQLLAHWGACPAFLDCNGNGVFDLIDIHDATSPDCNGNAVPDECDIASGASPDFNGNGTPDECEPARNDDCQNAIGISEGDTPFLSFGATTSVPLAICTEPLTFANDIWWLYTAPCTGIATLTLCNQAQFDTVLAVYFAGTCPPPLNPLACSDDAPGCGETSEVNVVVVEGFPYLVRVGGREGGGAGVLSVSCKPFASEAASGAEATAPGTSDSPENKVTRPISWE